MEGVETVDECRAWLRDAALLAHGLLERMDSNELDASPIARAHFAGIVAALEAAEEALPRLPWRGDS